MRLVYKGRCKNIENLPKGNLPENAVKFKEPGNSLELNIRAAVFIIPAIAVIAIFYIIKMAITHSSINPFPSNNVGLIIVFISIFPHELLHAICFPKGAIVELYFTFWGAFVISTYPITKARFILLSLLPCFVLGIVPLFLWLMIPNVSAVSSVIYTFGTFSLLLSCGDFMNVYNALRQMPKGSYQQLSGFNSYWFLND